MHSALHHKVAEVQNLKFLQLIFFFHNLSSEIERKGKGKGEEMKRKGRVPYLEFVLCTNLTHPSAHTVNTHPEQWAANAAAPGEQLGVRCLAQGHLIVVLRSGERLSTLKNMLVIHFWSWDSNPQPLGYKSDSLTIRPWLAPNLQ